MDYAIKDKMEGKSKTITKSEVWVAMTGIFPLASQVTEFATSLMMLKRKIFWSLSKLMHFKGHM